MNKIKFTHPFSAGIFGFPGSGKSHLLKYLMFLTKAMFDIVIVITGTKHNDFFNFVNKDFVHEYSNNIIETIIRKTTQWKEQKKNIKMLVVFDDILGCSKFNNEIWAKLVNNHRHYNISYIIVSQYIKGITPNIRSNLHFAFVFGQSNKTSINGLFESFFISHFDQKETIKLLSNLKRFQCVFVNNREFEKNKKFKLFTAPEKVPKFLITNKISY